MNARRSLPLLLVFFACAAASCAQEAPRITLPAEVRGQTGELVPVTADTLGSNVAWLTPDEGLRIVPSTALKDSRTTQVIACKAGRYRLQAITCAGGTLSAWATTVVIIEDAPAPKPAAAGAKPLWLVVIEETGQRTARQAAILADPDLGRYVRSKGWGVRVADRDAVDRYGRTPGDLRPYVARARGKQLPYLIVVDGEGHARHEGTVPADAKSLLADLQKVGG